MFRLIRYIVLVLLLLPFWASAWHIVGGEITYKCIGNEEYEITMIVYRDCSSDQGADYDDPANIAIYEDTTLFKNLELRPRDIVKLEADIYDPCFSVPTGVCVQRGVYRTTIKLPLNGSGYTISYQRCCRNRSLKNIVDPKSVGTTLTTKIPGAGLAQCNNSAVYLNTPPLAICLGSEFRFDHSATDADGDSLVYRFCNPYIGGSDIVRTPGPPNSIMPIPATPPPYTSVPWAAGYGTNNPFNLVGFFTIDPQTGLLSGTPKQSGQYLYGICVEEYRNGVKIGETRREYQVNVVLCKSNTKANFVTPPKCEGLSVNFTNTSITTRYNEWDFGIAGTVADTSRKSEPSFTFPDTGAYTVRLIANPGLKCADTIVKEIKLYPKLEPIIQGESEKCVGEGLFKFVASGTFEPYTKISWEFGNGAEPGTKTGMIADSIKKETKGDFSVKLIMSHGECEVEAVSKAAVFPVPVLKYALRNIEGCAPLRVQVEDLTEAETETFNVWTLSEKRKSSITSTNKKERFELDEPGDYILSLISYTKTGCVDTVGPKEFVLSVYDSPEAGFNISEHTVSIFDPVIEVTDASQNRKACWLYFGNDEVSRNCEGVHEFKAPGVYRVSQIVENVTGCQDTASAIVTVENEYAFFIPNSFTPNVDGKNESFRPIVVGAKTYEMQIRDRWGQQIFLTTDLKVGWDGKDEQSGKAMPIGVYIYRVKVIDHLDEPHVYVGSVNLFR